MDLLKMILGANDGGNVRQLAGKFGLEETEAKSAVEHLLPSLAQGFKNNMGKPEGSASMPRRASRPETAVVTCCRKAGRVRRQRPPDLKENQ